MVLYRLMDAGKDFLAPGSEPGGTIAAGQPCCRGHLSATTSSLRRYSRLGRGDPVWRGITPATGPDLIAEATWPPRHGRKRPPVFGNPGGSLLTCLALLEVILTYVITLVR